MIIGESETSALQHTMQRDRVPAWASALITILFILTAFCLSAAWNRNEHTQEETDTLKSRTSVLESQISGLKGWMEKIDNKMEKLLDESRRH